MRRRGDEAVRTVDFASFGPVRRHVNIFSAPQTFAHVLDGQTEVNTTHALYVRVGRKNLPPRQPNKGITKKKKKITGRYKTAKSPRARYECTNVCASVSARLLVCGDVCV